MSVSLSEHLPLLAEAPDGIKKLRGLILELAVRGKLVPQDPNDEPASELLKRIAAEKARLVEEGKIRKDKPLVALGEDEKPFELPVGWAWVRLDQICHDWGQKTPDAPFTYIDVSAIDNLRGSIENTNIIAPTDAPSRARKLVKIDTIIYSTVRPYLLNIAVIDRELSPEPIASTAFAVLHPLGGILSRYIFWYLRSPVFVRYVESVQTGIAYPAINDTQFFGGLFPLSPVAEQHRIVAKVDELMALCDRMEAEQADAEAGHATLVQTLLGTLTQSRDAAELAANWQRLSQHFDTLFTTEASIDALKQTILQLAVMGKLVPQDSSDEPASELLKRIAAEKARLVAKGKTRKEKALPPVGEEEKPFELPVGWDWIRLCETSEINGGFAFKSSQYVEGGVRVVRISDFDEKGFKNDKIVRYSYSNELTNYQLEPDNILMAMTGGTVGKSLFVKELPEPMVVNQRVATIKISPSVVPAYIYSVIQTDLVQQVIQDAKNSTNDNISMVDINGFFVPLPPLAEQHRIVAKVDELMALCGSLKADLAESRAQQARLATTLIESALAA